MKPSAPHSDSVWKNTLPALSRHRRRCRLVRASLATLLLAGFLGTLTWHAPEPTKIPEPVAITVAVTPPQPPESAPSSLAVLIVNAEGIHFEQLRPEDLSLEGLEFDLSLEPVIAGRFY